jgi:C4-dicarboxylate-specific signal transduction histidine kinase
MEAKAAALQEVLRRIQPVIPNSLSPSDSMPLQRVIELAAGALKFDLFFKHKVAKEIMVAEGLPPVRQGASLLQSAVYLLLRNALEAVRDQDERRVAVRAGANGAVVEIRVEDNGPGVPGEILPRLGEPFVSSKPSHAGLGLHLARVVMEDRGGTLRHERADGLTRFILAFPVEP